MDGAEGKGNDLSSMFADRRFKGAVLLLTLVLATFFLMKTFVEAKTYRYIGSGTTATNTISVSGEGDAYAVPDIATFTYSVTEESLSVADAQEAAATKQNAINAFLKESGIDVDKDVTTTGYNIYPRYEYETKNVICPQGSYCPPQQGERVLRGYEVTQSVTVKVRDTSKAGTLLGGVGGKGATNISGLNFTFDDPNEVQDAARNDAIADAREKAKELARALNVRLVRVVNFSEGYGGGVYKGMDFMAMDAVRAESAPAAMPDIPVGENHVVSNVTITYEIR